MIQSTRQPDALLRWMGNLADSTRLRILRLLERQELGVVDLCEVLQMPQSTVSRHLKLLADERWVQSRKQGTTHYYRMSLDELDARARDLWLLARKQTDDWATFQQDQVRLTHRVRETHSTGDAQAFFEDVAERWDRTREQMYGSSFVRDALLALLPEQWVVADLGCGTGTQTRELARFMKHVVGVDSSHAMLDAARGRTGHLSNVELHHSDLTTLPIEAGTCDAALLVLVLSYLSQPDRVVGEMARILKPGGRAVVVTLLRHDREDFRRRMGQRAMGFEPGQLEELLSEAGFARTSCLTLPPDPEAKGPALLLARGTV